MAAELVCGICLGWGLILGLRACRSLGHRVLSIVPGLMRCSFSSLGSPGARVPGPRLAVKGGCDFQLVAHTVILAPPSQLRISDRPMGRAESVGDRR